VNGDGGLILLNEKNNNNLVNFLSEKYPKIDDYDALTDLSTMIKERAKDTIPNAKGKINVSFTREEITEIFEPSGLLESNPNLIENIVEDFS